MREKSCNTLSTSSTSPIYQTACVIYNMNKHHKEDIQYYGSDNNKLRLGGKNEASSYDKFSYGVANRGCSVRIPRTFIKNQEGYIEDRRPGSDMDPYIVTKIIASYAIPIDNSNNEIEEIMKNISQI
jgi:glutamine synthetase